MKGEVQAPQNSNVVSDQIVCFPRLAREGEEPVLFRRVEIWDREKQESIVFLSEFAGVWGDDHCGHLQGPLAGGTIFENSTWCTPLDVIIFRGSIALNRPLMGSLDVSVRPRIAPRPLCAESRARSHKACDAGNCFNRINRNTIQWSSCDVECGGTFTDGHLVAGLPLSLTVDQNRMVVA